jgi:hypothetical protein
MYVSFSSPFREVLSDSVFDILWIEDNLEFRFWRDEFVYYNGSSGSVKDFLNHCLFVIH